MLPFKMSTQMPILHECKTVKSLKIRSPADGEEQEHSSKVEKPINQRDSKDMSTIKDNAPEEALPPYFRWAQNLHNLLNDCEGVHLFKQYLKQECQDSYNLDFWFAAKGVQAKQNDDTKRMLMTIISNRYLHKLPDINPETKTEIVNKIENKDFDDMMFQKAQKEVETVMMRTTYPNFLKSDLYMQHIQQMQQNSNVNNNNNIEHENNSSSDSSDPSLMKQSMLKGSMESLDILQTVYEDSELEISSCNNKVPVPGIRRPGERESNNKCLRLKPESQAGHYLKPHASGYNTYYAKYSSYLPPSAQDSEFQSLSSDVQTDDTMSIISSSTDRETKNHSKSCQSYSHERRRRSLKPINSDVLTECTVIPRTQILNAPQQSQEEFTELLMEKLVKVVESRKLEERLNERLQEDINLDNHVEPAKTTATSSNCAPNLLPFAKMQSAPDSAQSILDDHVSRVFYDSAHQTPSPSPGCLTPSATNATTQEALSKRRNAPHNPTSGFLNYCSYNESYSNRLRKDLDNCRDSGTEFSSDEYLQSASVLNEQRLAHGHHPIDTFDHGCSGRYRESSRRTSNKKPYSGDCNSSCFDSGIEAASSSSSTRQKVTAWIDTLSTHTTKDHYYQKSPQSVSPIVGQSGRKSGACRPMDSTSSIQWYGSNIGNNTSVVETVYCRNVSGSQHNQLLDQNPFFVEDPDTQMMLTKKGLDYVKQKLKPLSNSRYADFSRSRAFEESTMHKKSSRKSYPSNAMVVSNMPQPQVEMTAIAYSYGRTTVPFLCKLPGKCILLKQFKSLLCKKGNFRYFFVKDSEEFGKVFEEISDDSEVLPLWEGKILCQIEQME